MTKPTKRTTPDEWGAENRIYPPHAPVPGPRDPYLTPYAIEFGRVTAGKRYRRTVQVMAAQGGKTETFLDLIGQRLDQSPAPILYVGPNKQFLNEQFEPRLMALLDEAPKLKRKVARGKRMTKTRKLIAGVPLRLAHAGSPTALKSDPIALTITDEVDDLLANVKGQGDPIGLADARGDNYGQGAVHAMVSTPSVGVKEVERDAVSGLEFWMAQDPEDLASAIWKFWQSGTRHHWAWQCPSCTEWFIPRFDCLHYEGKGKEATITAAQAKATAVVVCPSNGCVIHNGDKARMNERGVYVAPGQTISHDGRVEGEPVESDTASFWVSGLCTPFKSFGERAARYVEAVQSGDPEKIQTAMNAGFGELWSPATGDAPEWTEVAECKAPYMMGEVPEGVVFLTAGVDVQKRKLVYVIRGWGVRQESWLIDAGELHGSGDTRLDDVWLDLSELLDTEFLGMRIMRAFVDSGFNPSKQLGDIGDEHKVYEFCRRHARTCYATKGYDYRSQPISVNRIDVKPSGGRPKYGLDLVRLDSDFLKFWVHSRVRWPKGEAGGWHLPTDITEEFCRQITNESRARKPGGGFTWVPSGDRDFLDCEALAFGAAKMLGLDRLTDNTPRGPRRAAERAQTPLVDDEAPAPQPSRHSQRQGSGWLGDRTENWLRR